MHPSAYISFSLSTTILRLAQPNAFTLHFTQRSGGCLCDSRKSRRERFLINHFYLECLWSAQIRKRGTHPSYVILQFALKPLRLFRERVKSRLKLAVQYLSKWNEKPGCRFNESRADRRHRDKHLKFVFTLGQQSLITWVLSSWLIHHLRLQFWSLF